VSPDVVILTHPSCLAHDPGPGHPECPERLQAVLTALDRPVFAGIPRITAPQASVEQLSRAHDRDLIEAIFGAAPDFGRIRVDPDTAMSPASLDAALRAAGAACEAVDAVMSGRVQRAFCAVRPPGHHATRAQAMGFCLFNSIAVAAAHAIATHDLLRIAVVDFDVHHGNGTQDIFWDEPRVMFASSHQSPLYPGSGNPGERGTTRNIHNVPLAPGSDSLDFRAVWEETLLPAIDRFEPELILVSAGFDAHRLDPLANLNLEADDYGWLTAELVALARRHAGGRLVSCLEGGYSLTALREGTGAHCTELFDLR
jgi:acetoin utilization deacetylase AcuC-like enzyme